MNIVIRHLKENYFDKLVHTVQKCAIFVETGERLYPVTQDTDRAPIPTERGKERFAVAPRGALESLH